MLDHLRIAATIGRHKCISVFEFIIIPAFLITSLAVLGMTVWKATQWFALASTIQDHSPRITAENEIMRTVAQILGGAFVLIGLYFSAKSVFVSREGQMSDRFTKALESLGDEGNINRRIGGIYALERFVRDSPRDHWRVMEILTNYLRSHAPYARPDSEYISTPIGKPPLDVLAAITVIGRRDRVYRFGESRQLDLREINLEGADLREAHLEGARLTGSNLRGAILYKANLNDADLTHVILVQANLNRVKLQRANLHGADLRRANIREVSLKKSIFAEANLSEASLDNSRFTDVTFSRANLDEATLDDAVLEKCTFADAVLRGTSLRRAQIIDAISLSPAQIKTASIDNFTKLPFIRTMEGS